MPIYGAKQKRLSENDEKVREKGKFTYIFVLAAGRHRQTQQPIANFQYLPKPKLKYKNKRLGL
jgi:hypothetical protein